jgi:hypothetical protein
MVDRWDESPRRLRSQARKKLADKIGPLCHSCRRILVILRHPGHFVMPWYVDFPKLARACRVVSDRRNSTTHVAHERGFLLQVHEAWFPATLVLFQTLKNRQECALDYVLSEARRRSAGFKAAFGVFRQVGDVRI